MTRKSSAATRSNESTLITPALLRARPLPKPEGTLGKESRGTVLAVGGSNSIPGGVLLAAVAAMRAGAGTLRIATTRDAATMVGVAVPEACVTALGVDRAGEIAQAAAKQLGAILHHCDALLVGPGMRSDATARAMVRRAERARFRGACVLDAKALCVFEGSRPLRATHARFPGGVIATPHAGEMAKLRGIERSEVLNRPLEIAREAARDLHVVMVLKGECTYVVAPSGEAFHNTAGNPGLGTSGSGDTLSGVIAGLAARGATPIDAAIWGVFLHATAGDVLARRIGPLGFLARELLEEIPALMARFARPGAAQRQGRPRP